MKSSSFSSFVLVLETMRKIEDENENDDEDDGKDREDTRAYLVFIGPESRA
jgi:hypothetical protein